MNGIGNEILVVDLRGVGGRVTPDAARALAARAETRFDQIMAIQAPRMEGTDAHIRILNSDGSEAEACGNGTRCVVQALGSETGQKSFRFEIAGRLVAAEEHGDGTVSVDMGAPLFGWRDIPLSEEFADTRAIELQVGPIDAPVLHSPAVVSIGNPHAVFWVDNDVWSYALDRFGPILENHPLFPERCNITIAAVTSRNAMTIRTWERGAGLTRACGSAACAAAVAAARTRRTGRAVEVTLPGGRLRIDWREVDDHIVMTGPAEWEWSGRLDPATGDFERDAPEVASA
ncbi:diaminopimelate epimerase [Aureimonas leprariae]|uniref:Diaminopimelate epimerase n=2 Tax=Plantimonas leprariae TaxID=2615207 RepID=A0A7V7PRT3_9HYPH|nr:diaminopimelate epimerase [Aureimonas leprariae]